MGYIKCEMWIYAFDFCFYPTEHKTVSLFNSDCKCIKTKHKRIMDLIG